MVKFPIHHRRISLLEAKQVGEPLDFVRELIEFTRLAEWNTFSEESAICHLFLNSVKCDEARKIWFKILRKNSEGDSKKLIAELQTLKTLQNVHNQEGKAKPVFQRTACPKCNIKGHLEKYCWGQCNVCEGWGHQTKH